MAWAGLEPAMSVDSYLQRNFVCHFQHQAKGDLPTGLREVFGFKALRHLALDDFFGYGGGIWHLVFTRCLYRTMVPNAVKDRRNIHLWTEFSSTYFVYLFRLRLFSARFIAFLKASRSRFSGLIISCSLHQYLKALFSAFSFPSIRIS